MNFHERTHITFVLDSSGSMSAIKGETIAGFNSFLTDQKEESGEATVSLYEFNDTVENFFQMRPIETAPKLNPDTYTPSGSTALFDAIVQAVDETAAIIDGLPNGGRPDLAIIVVLTDGRENASETSEAEVRERVTNRREHHDWEFMFIGANQDAALTAETMGMDADHSLDMAHNGKGTQAAYSSISESVSRARRQGETGGFTEEDQKQQKGSGTEGNDTS